MAVPHAHVRANANAFAAVQRTIHFVVGSATRLDLQLPEDASALGDFAHPNMVAICSEHMWPSEEIGLWSKRVLHVAGV